MNFHYQKAHERYTSYVSPCTFPLIAELGRELYEVLSVLAAAVAA